MSFYIHMAKNSILIVLFLHILLLFSSWASAQTEAAIRGEAVAQADGSTVPGVKLILEGTGLIEPLQTVSDNSGRFAFSRLTPGEYFLTAEHNNFATRRLSLLLKPRQIQKITLELSIRSLTESVEVFSQAGNVPNTYSPSSRVLQSDEVARLPMVQRVSLPEVIAVTTPGMIRGHDDFVHVRGHELALNTFVNGVSFWENPHTVFSPGLSPEIIQSASVMTGGFPAEYGNRFGGVVDLVTKSGFSLDNQGSLTLGAGTASRHNVALEYGGHTERVGYYLFTSGFESARFLSPPDRRSIHNTGRGSQHFLQLDFNLDANDFIRTVFIGNGTNFEIPKTSLDDQIRPQVNAFQRNRQQKGIFTWTHVFSRDISVDTSLYEAWSRSRLLPAAGPLTARAEAERTLLTTGIKSDLTYLLERHALKIGTDLVLLRPQEELFYDYDGYRQLTHRLDLPHIHIKDRKPIVFEGRKSGGQASLYIQDKVQLADHLTVEAGLRYDQYSLAVSESQLSPRVNLVYRFAGSNTLLHASYNRFFVSPPIENVLLGSAGLTRLIQEIGRPLGPLRSSVGNQWEVGALQALRPFAVGLTGYYRAGKNPVHTVVFPDSRVYTYTNFDRERAYGLEVKVNLPTAEQRSLSGYLNYALGRVNYYGPAIGGFISEVEHLEAEGRFLAPMDQTHTFNAGLTYRHRRNGVWAGTVLEFGSGTPIEAGPWAPAWESGVDPWRARTWAFYDQSQHWS